MTNSPKVKVSGSWRTASKAYVKVSGSWKEAKEIYIKVNGMWMPDPKIPADTYSANYEKNYFDTWGIDLQGKDGNGWDTNTLYTRMGSTYHYMIDYYGADQQNEREHLVTDSFTNWTSGETRAVYFKHPAILGYSDKQCYIKNNSSWYSLNNAASVDSGWYLVTFNGSTFTASK